MQEVSASDGQTFGNDSDAGSGFGQSSDRSGPRHGRRKRQTRLNEKTASPEETSQPAPGTMYRTKKLIAAAIRVWELKRGLRG